jgi:hypothetical protein
MHSLWSNGNTVQPLFSFKHAPRFNKFLTYIFINDYCSSFKFLLVTIAARSKACTVFARSEARIVGSNLTQGMNVWCVYAFILCLGKGLATGW